MGNHWSDDGDLVIEEKTLFRQVGWVTDRGQFFEKRDEAIARAASPGGYSPVYQQIATWAEGEGWKD